MAYREVSCIGIKEVIRRGQLGVSQRRIASGTGLFQVTVERLQGADPRAACWMRLYDRRLLAAAPDEAQQLVSPTGHDALGRLPRRSHGPLRPQPTATSAG